MAHVACPQRTVPGLIVAAYHAGIQSTPFQTPPYPTAEIRALVKVVDAKKLLLDAEDAIRENDQRPAAAAIPIYGDHGHPVKRVFDLMLKYMVREDVRLHGEKYYHTVPEEYRTTRSAFRRGQFVALAGVTAGAYGYNREDKHGSLAAGYEEACRLLGVEA